MEGGIIYEIKLEHEDNTDALLKVLRSFYSKKLPS